MRAQRSGTGLHMQHSQRLPCEGDRGGCAGGRVDPDDLPAAGSVESRAVRADGKAIKLLILQIPGPAASGLRC